MLSFENMQRLQTEIHELAEELEAEDASEGGHDSGRGAGSQGVYVTARLHRNTSQYTLTR
jgi:hypothetical protein